MEIYRLPSDTNDELELTAQVTDKLSVRPGLGANAAHRLKERREEEEARREERRAVLLDEPLPGGKKGAVGRTSAGKLKKQASATSIGSGVGRSAALRASGSMMRSVSAQPPAASRADGSPAPRAGTSTTPNSPATGSQARMQNSRSSLGSSSNLGAVTSAGPGSTAAEGASSANAEPVPLRTRLIQLLALRPRPRRELVSMLGSPEPAVLQLLPSVAYADPNQPPPGAATKHFAGPVNRRVPSRPVAPPSARAGTPGPGTVYLLKDEVHREVRVAGWDAYSREDRKRVSERMEAAFQRIGLRKDAEEWEKLFPDGRDEPARAPGATRGFDEGEESPLSDADAEGSLPPASQEPVPSQPADHHHDAEGETDGLSDAPSSASLSRLGSAANLHGSTSTSTKAPAKKKGTTTMQRLTRAAKGKGPTPAERAAASQRARVRTSPVGSARQSPAPSTSINAGAAASTDAGASTGQTRGSTYSANESTSPAKKPRLSEARPEDGGNGSAAHGGTTKKQGPSATATGAVSKSATTTTSTTTKFSDVPARARPRASEPALTSNPSLRTSSGSGPTLSTATGPSGASGGGGRKRVSMRDIEYTDSESDSGAPPRKSQSQVPRGTGSGNGNGKDSGRLMASPNIGPEPKMRKRRKTDQVSSAAAGARDSSADGAESDGTITRRGVGAGAAHASEPWLDVQSLEDWTRLTARFGRTYEEYTRMAVRLESEKERLERERAMARREREEEEEEVRRVREEVERERHGAGAGVEAAVNASGPQEKEKGGETPRKETVDRIAMPTKQGRESPEEGEMTPDEPSAGRGRPPLDDAASAQAALGSGTGDHDRDRESASPGAARSSRSLSPPSVWRASASDGNASHPGQVHAHGLGQLHGMTQIHAHGHAQGSENDSAPLSYAELSDLVARLSELHGQLERMKRALVDYKRSSSSSTSTSNSASGAGGRASGATAGAAGGSVHRNARPAAVAVS